MADEIPDVEPAAMVATASAQRIHALSMNGNDTAGEAGVEGVCTIALRIERPRGRVERAPKPAQVTRGESDLRLGDLAARPGGVRGAPAGRHGLDLPDVF